MPDPSSLPPPVDSRPTRPGTGSRPAGAVVDEPGWQVADLLPRLREAGIAAEIDARDADSGYGPQLVLDGPAAAARTPDDGLTLLVETGLVRIAGRDAASFLQGQLTNDVTAATTERAILAGLCNPKGRLIATFHLWREPAGEAGDEAAAAAAGDVFWLACSRDLTALLARRLRMFVLRAKVAVTTHDHDRVAIGLIGGHAVAIGADALVEHDSPADRPVVLLPAPQGHGTGAGQPVPRAIAIATLDELGVVVARARASAVHWLDTAVWRWHEVLAGMARITAATSERFVPQMVNFERTGGVSFTKGCYPGQEVVARSHYRGTHKRRGFLVAGEGALPVPGQDLDPAAGQQEPAGTVVLAARDPAAPGRWTMFAEARLDAAAGGLAWSAKTTEPIALPYPISDAPAADGGAG